MRFIIIALLVLVGFAAELLAADDSVEVLKTPSGVRFGIWPKRPIKPAPTLFVFASSIEGTLESAYFRQAGDALAKEGWVLVSVDLPCHGQEVRPEESAGLSGWRSRIDKDEDIMQKFTPKLKSVLDQLIKEDIADPQQIAALGTSRGGFVAFHFAAADKRVKWVAGFSPVTDLAALSEFRGAQENPLVSRLKLENQAEKLAGRSLWLVIGDRDTRVSTDAAIQFARRVTTVSLKKGLSPQVDLHIIAEPKGHTVPKGYAELAADWFRARRAETIRGMK